MGVAVLVDAVRTPIGKLGGALSGLHATAVLGKTLAALLDRTHVRAADVGQIVGGCVTQIGEQSFNVTRMAWLAAGLPVEVGATTVDCQCGSSQQANHIVSNMIAAGVIDIGIACGVEMMSRVPMGANTAGPGRPKPEGFPYDLPNQFVAAERLARKHEVTRAAADAYAELSQRRAAEAHAAGNFARELVPVGTLAVDEGLRPTTLEGLTKLAALREGGIHTAGNVSQISDGAAAVLWMSEARAAALGLTPRAVIREQVLVGTDPYFHIEGPIDATRALLARAKLRLTEIDWFEINEAFAAVVLAWQHTFDVDPARINQAGGAIALGHPMGASGARLLTTALHGLERTEGQRALIAMCCGGALATGTIIERI